MTNEERARKAREQAAAIARQLELRAATAAAGGAGGTFVNLAGWVGDRMEYTQEQVLGGALRDITGGVGDATREYGAGAGGGMSDLGKGAGLAVAIAAVTVPVSLFALAAFLLRR